MATSKGSGLFPIRSPVRRSLSTRVRTGAPPCRKPPPLARYAGFAAVVAASGIPLYIHLPAFLATRYGIALETLGGLLVVLRLVDFAQEPGLGWLQTRLGRWRDAAVLVAAWRRVSRLPSDPVVRRFMVLFFAAAAASTPVWWRLAMRIGARNALALGMGLAIASFVWVFTLQSGDVLAFTLICLASGAALGATMLLLPAMFSAHQEKTDGNRALAFGFWTFVGKATLAISAGIVLPLLARAGFSACGPQDPAALEARAILYALVPCGLKAAALVLLLAAFRTSDAPSQAIQQAP